MSLNKRTWAMAVLLAASWSMLRISVAQAEDPERPPNEQEALVSAGVARSARETAAQSLLSAVYSLQVGNHSIGVTVVPADATLRTQLALPAEEGLVVTNVDLNSSAWEAGLAQHDVLLRLDDKPIATPDDLNQRVDAVGERPAGVLVIRNGKRMKLQLIPKRVNRLELVSPLSADAVQTRFRIGVELAAADETLRVQLKLPEGQGVTVTNVIDDGPAVTAGIKKHDVLLMLGDKPVASSEEFRDKLQDVGEKPVTIKLIREGKPISIDVTPQKHQEPTWVALSRQNLQPLTLDVLRPAAITGEIEHIKVLTPDVLQSQPLVLFNDELTPAAPQARLQELIDQMKELQKKLEALSEELKKQHSSPDAAEKK